MRRLFRLAVVGALVTTVTGCFHYTANVPGVLDLRSDGSDAAPASGPIVVKEGVTRSGFDEILDGKGVQVNGSTVIVEDRHTWIGITSLAPGMLLLFNGDSRPEMEVALGEKGALRNVYIGHRYDVMDFLIEFGEGVVLGLCPPLSAVVFTCVPPGNMTFTASGQRVSTTPGGRPSPSPLAPKRRDPVPTDPAPIEPVPIEPVPIDPAPVAPAPVAPVPVEPAPVEPAPTAPTEPGAGVPPPPEKPAPTSPEAEPAPTDAPADEAFEEDK